VDAAKSISIPDPLNGEPFTHIPDTQGPSELQPFVDSLRAVPKSGLHNPLKHPERCVAAGCLLWGLGCVGEIKACCVAWWEANHRVMYRTVLP